MRDWTRKLVACTCTSWVFAYPVVSDDKKALHELVIRTEMVLQFQKASNRKVQFITELGPSID